MTSASTPAADTGPAVTFASCSGSPSTARPSTIVCAELVRIGLERGLRREHPRDLRRADMRIDDEVPGRAADRHAHAPRQLARPDGVVTRLRAHQRRMLVAHVLVRLAAEHLHVVAPRAVGLAHRIRRLRDVEHADRREPSGLGADRVRERLPQVVQREPRQLAVHPRIGAPPPEVAIPRLGLISSVVDTTVGNH